MLGFNTVTKICKFKTAFKLAYAVFFFNTQKHGSWNLEIDSELLDVGVTTWLAIDKYLCPLWKRGDGEIFFCCLTS